MAKPLNLSVFDNIAKVSEAQVEAVKKAAAAAGLEVVQTESGFKLEVKCKTYLDGLLLVAEFFKALKAEMPEARLLVDIGEALEALTLPKSDPSS